MLEFPNDPATFSMDDQFMLGSALVIKPVVQAGQKNVDIYLGKNNLWYDYDTFEAVKPVDGRFVVETPLEKVAMFIRGGSIIVRRDRVRRASLLMKNDPYTVIVALDKQVLILLNKGKSAGSLYVDDGKSFEYQQGQFIYTEFKFEKGTLSSLVNADGKGAFDNRVERIIVTGLVNTPTNISVGEKKVEFYVEKVGSGIRITLKNPPVSVGQVWAVKFQ